MPHDVFISYSSKNKAVADAVCARLETMGARCWIAPRDIRPGTEWGEAIIDGIRGSRLLVLIFSAGANASPQVRREVERAVGHDIPILPFRIEDVPLAKSLEYFISNQHWLDAVTPPLSAHIDRLAQAVGRQLGSETLAPRPPMPVRHAGDPYPKGHPVTAMPSFPPLPPPRRSFPWIAIGVTAVLLVVAGLLVWLVGAAGSGGAGNAPAIQGEAGRAPAAPVQLSASPAINGTALIGTWSGVVLEPRSATHPQYPITIRLERDGAGRLVGAVTYRDFPCSGVWALAGQDGAVFHFRETILDGRDKCANDATAHLQLAPDGRFLSLEIYPAGQPEQAGRGTLNREP